MGTRAAKSAWCGPSNDEERCRVGGRFRIPYSKEPGRRLSHAGAAYRAHTKRIRWSRQVSQDCGVCRAVAPSNFKGDSPRGAWAANLNTLPPSEIGFVSYVDSSWR